MVAEKESQIFSMFLSKILAIYVDNLTVYFTSSTKYMLDYVNTHFSEIKFRETWGKLGKYGDYGT